MYRTVVRANQCSQNYILNKIGEFCSPKIQSKLFLLINIFIVVRNAATNIIGEPKGPTVKTEIPGPKSKALLKELNALQVLCFFYYKNLSRQIICREIILIIF